FTIGCNEPPSRLVFVAADGSRSYRRYQWEHGLQTARWHHLVIVFDTQQGKFYYYLDGKLHHEMNILKNARFENRFVQISRSGEDGFTGSLDEFAAFRRSLTSDEVAVLYKHGLNGKSLAAK